MTKRWISIIILTIIFALALSACADTEITLVSVAVEEGTIKTTYSLNEAIDLTGARLILTYSNGATSSIAITEDMLTEFSTANVGGGSMVVTYQGRRTSLSYSVSSNSSITIISAEPKNFITEYFVNEEIKLSGAKVNVVFSDGTIDSFEVTSGMVTASSFNTKSATAENASRNLQITVSTKAGMASCTVEYTVRARAAIHSFSIKNAPELVFQQNSSSARNTLDTILSMQEFVIVYSDDIENEISVNYSELTLSNFNTATVGTGLKLKLRFTDSYNRTKDLELIYNIIEPITEYAVTYHENYEGGKVIPSVTVNGKAPMRSVANRAGYEFLGWYRKTGDVYSNNPWDFSTLVTEELTLYANWSKIEYTISYSGVPSGSLNAEQFTRYDVNSNYAFYPEEKNGYIFEGFDKGDGATFIILAKGTTGDLTLTAVWTPIQYTLTYDYNDGEPPITANPEFFTVESEFALEPPTRSGYDFMGWIIQGTSLRIQGISAGYTRNLALIAEWNIITYTIEYVFRANESIVGGRPISYKITDDNIVIPPATKANHAFAGWYRNEARTIEMPKIVGDYVILGGSMGNLTLYAKFYINYEIFFDAVDAEVLIGNNAVVNLFFHENEPTVILPPATKPNHTFAGWRTGGTTFQAGAISAALLKAKAIDNTITLVAIWEE